MAADATTPSKRGNRKANKRPHKEAKHVDNGDEDGAAATKRGRGRPKVTKKTKTPAKPKGKSAAGRSKAEKKAKDSGDEDNKENDAEDDLDDYISSNVVGP